MKWYSSFHFSFAHQNVLEILTKYNTSHITVSVRDIFQEAKRQFFGSSVYFYLQWFVLCSWEIDQLSCFGGLEVYAHNGPH